MKMVELQSILYCYKSCVVSENVLKAYNVIFKAGLLEAVSSESNDCTFQQHYQHKNEFFVLNFGLKLKSKKCTKKI